MSIDFYCHHALLLRTTTVAGIFVNFLTSFSTNFELDVNYLLFYIVERILCIGIYIFTKYLANLPKYYNDEDDDNKTIIIIIVEVVYGLD